MKASFRLTSKLVEIVRRDLAREHPFASERVGFISCRAGRLATDNCVILAHDYQPVEDADYLPDDAVGAMMGPAAIRKALQFAYNNQVGMFHVHMHDHFGGPSFSKVDLAETARFVPDFWNVRPEMPHGALVLSRNSACALCWYPQLPNPIKVTDVLVVGAPLVRIRNA